MYTFITKITDGNATKWVEVETSSGRFSKRLMDQINKKIAAGKFKESNFVPLESERVKYCIEVLKK